MRNFIFLMVMMMGFVYPSMSYAHTINNNYHFKYVEETPWGPMLEFRGNFVKGLKDDFMRMLTIYPKTKIISMSSPGGLLDEGYEVGRLLSNYRVSVWVPRDQACISACALAFIGGDNYMVSGLLAFHAPWLPAYDGGMKIMDIYSQGQNTGAVQSYWFALNGFRAQLYMTITQYTNRDTFLMFLNTRDLNYFLMHPERTYSEYLEFKDMPKTVLQGNGDLLEAVMVRKRLEVLRKAGEFNFDGSNSKLPSYRELQRLHRPKKEQ